MTRKQRKAIYQSLPTKCQFGEGWVKAVEVDKYGLAKALRLGTRRALRNISAHDYEEIILDGKVNYLPKKFKRGGNLIDADNLIPIVSAASIYAKVTRDRFMIELAKKYPVYKFETHVGYGTAEHMTVINTYGVLKFIHRQSYAPIAALAGQS